jgi:hypothetical protein
LPCTLVVSLLIWILITTDAAIPDRIAKFVVTLAGETLEFVIDTIDKVGKAISWIWDKLKIAFEKLMEFLAFLFGWGDVIDAKRSIHKLLDSSLDWGSDQVDWAKG